MINAESSLELSAKLKVDIHKAVKGSDEKVERTGAEQAKFLKAKIKKGEVLTYDEKERKPRLDHVDERKGQKTKAAIVREVIAANLKVEKKEVVTKIVEATGFTRQLAGVYFAKNVGKV
jgi:hypothetical protein